MSAHQLRLTHRKISRNSAANYYSIFRGLLKIAYLYKLIEENINDFLERIEWEDLKISQNKGYYKRIRTQKPQTEVVLSISYGVIERCMKIYRQSIQRS